MLQGYSVSILVDYLRRSTGLEAGIKSYALVLG